MARIRTIKPEFFRHEELFAAEIETKLPLRVAFAGLWTAADREGRFRWKPRQLKLDCLPFDEVDFSRVLDALATRGFLVKYASDSGDEFGCIPSWNAHQVINNRESESVLPSPEDCSIKSTTSTRAPRVDDACPTPLVHASVEGNGREGKGKEGKELSDANKSRRKQQYPADFFPNETGQSAAAAKGIVIAKELEKFRDYHLSKGNTMADWQAAWRTWVGNARPAPSQQESFAERDERRARERYEEMTGKKASTVIDITPAQLRVTA